MYMYLTDGLAVLTLRIPWLRWVWFSGLLIKFLITFFVLPLGILALIGWGLFLLFTRDEPEPEYIAPPRTALVLPPAPIEPIAAPEQKTQTSIETTPQTRNDEAVTSQENATSDDILAFLETSPPLTRTEHMRKARSAVSALNVSEAIENMKRVLQYDFQTSARLPEDTRELHEDIIDAFIYDRKTKEIGEFTLAANKFYSPHRSASEQRMDEMMERILKNAIEGRDEK